MSYNHLKDVDCTNAFLLKPNCIISFAYNSINTISNKNKVTYNRTQLDYFESGGNIDFTGNIFRSVPEPRSFGFDTHNHLGSLVFGRYIVQFRKNKFFCDCNLYPFLKAYHEVAHQYLPFGETFDICCNAPDHMKDFCLYLLNVYNVSEFDRLVCNSTSCIPGCECHYKPTRNTFYIQCTSADLSLRRSINFGHFKNTLTEELRMSFENVFIHANFSGNSLSTFRVQTFLPKTTELDLSNNFISKLERNVLLALKEEAIINISGNPDIKTLPKEIQRFKSSHIIVDGLVLQCRCEDEMHTWLPQWMKEGGQENRGKFFCQLEDGVLDVMDMDEDTLDCNASFFIRNMVIYSSLTVTLILFSILGNTLKYEAYVLYRKYQCKDVPKNVTLKYDIYIAMKENDNLVTWVLNTLCPFLENEGYKCFVPVRDLSFGSIREEELRKSILASKTYLIILADDSPDDIDNWMQIEWGCCWQNYIEQFWRRLVVIDYDFIVPIALSNRQLKALARLGFTLDFSQKQKFYKELLNQVGPPMFLLPDWLIVYYRISESALSVLAVSLSIRPSVYSPFSRLSFVMLCHLSIDFCMGKVTVEVRLSFKSSNFAWVTPN